MTYTLFKTFLGKNQQKTLISQLKCKKTYIIFNSQDCIYV